MTARYLELVERVRGEVPELERNVYTMNLTPNRVAGLISKLPELWPRLRSELLAFADFLEELGQADS